ncbi:MAG: hypothetical protein WCK13_09665 [Ignavibacteriota bacterium]|nr:hypothetical protein [Ignavibacteriota bacterium]
MADVNKDKGNLAKEVEMLIVARKIRYLGLVILLGVSLIFVMGLVVSGSNINPSLYYLNVASFIFCLVLCALSIPLKNMLMKKVTLEKFEAKYFNAYVLPYALCDFGGLLCITTSLFINQNIIFAALGYFAMASAVIYNFPKFDDHKQFR